MVTKVSGINLGHTAQSRSLRKADLKNLVVILPRIDRTAHDRNIMPNLGVLHPCSPLTLHGTRLVIWSTRDTQNLRFRHSLAERTNRMVDLSLARGSSVVGQSRLRKISRESGVRRGRRWSALPVGSIASSGNQTDDKQK